MDKYVTYGFTDKLRSPCGGFNSFAFALKRLVPDGSRLYRFRIQPPAELSGRNPENPAGAFLGKPLTDRVIYNINHSSFDLLFEMAF